MAQDEFGNYRADMDDCCLAVPPQSGLPIQIGAGPPTLTTPISPVYIDSDSNTVYINPTLTNDGWVALSGGGGSSQITSGVGSPITNGVSVVVFKVYFDVTNPAAPGMWAVASSAWREMIAAG